MADAPQVIIASDTHDISATPKRSADDIRADRQMRVVAFYIAMGFLVVAAIGTAYLAFIIPDTPTNVATKEWSRGILSAIIGGVIGFAFAKK
jgi:cytochrome c biogenesis protein CcdA